MGLLFTYINKGRMLADVGNHCAVMQGRCRLLVSTLCLVGDVSNYIAINALFGTSNLEG